MQFQYPQHLQQLQLPLFLLRQSRRRHHQQLYYHYRPHCLDPMCLHLLWMAQDHYRPHQNHRPNPRRLLLQYCNYRRRHQQTQLTPQIVNYRHFHRW